MNFTEKAGLVIVSVLLSLAIAGGTYYVAKPAALRGVMNPYRAPADDAPIIMAGGSLYIGNDPAFEFTQNSSNMHQLDYSAPMQVFRVDVSYFDAMGNAKTDSIPVSAAGSVSLDYCKPSGCGGGNKDTIKLAWNASNKITITNTWGTGQKLALLLPNLRVHGHKKWIPTAVTGAGGASSLPNEDCTQFSDAECNVVVHTCNPGVTCTGPSS